MVGAPTEAAGRIAFDFNVISQLGIYGLELVGSILDYKVRRIERSKSLAFRPFANSKPGREGSKNVIDG